MYYNNIILYYIFYHKIRPTSKVSPCMSKNFGPIRHKSRELGERKSGGGGIIHFKKACLILLKHNCFWSIRNHLTNTSQVQSQVGEHSIKLHGGLSLHASARELTDASLIANTEKSSSLVNSRTSRKQPPPNKYCILTNEGFLYQFYRACNIDGVFLKNTG